MDELRAQLRRLGEAAQNEVEPIDPANVMVEPTATAIDVGTGKTPPPARIEPRRLSRRSVVGMAAALLVVLGSLTLINRSGSEDAVGITSAQEAAERSAPTDDNGWQELRTCESEADYSIDTGNSFYGAYQFTRQAFNDTAERLGLTDYVGVNPAAAPPYIQDAVAAELYLEEGADPWPICGRFIRGPMITPVVPQWLQSTAVDENQTVVYVSPYLSPDRLDEIAEELAQLVEPYTDAQFALVDQQALMAEFQVLYRDHPDALRSVRESDLAPRFEIAAAVPASVLSQIQELDDVFDAFDETPIARRGPLRLSIPAIGLETPVRSSASISSLAEGPVVIVDDSGMLAIAGYGSFEGSDFARLDELRNGDQIIVTTLVSEGDSRFEVVRRFVVDRNTSNGAPAVRDSQDLLLWRTPAGQGLTLVADVAEEPTKRLFVRTQPADPDLGQYAVAGIDS